jgi:hypothetical protein
MIEMRFTKHLTAIACAVAVLSVSAPHLRAQEVYSGQEADGMFWHPGIGFLEVLFGSYRTDLEGVDQQKGYIKKNKKKEDYDSFWAGTNEDVKYPKNLLPDYACQPDNQSCKTTKDAIYAISSKVGIEYNDVIIGVTAGGERKKLYCGTARPCTAGSLNKVAIEQGLEFMVPADMLATAGDYPNAWEDVAAILWSKEFADDYEDSNAKSARNTLTTNANVYARNRKTSQQAADEQQTNDGNTNTTAGVVVNTTAVVDCDALCESERM